MRNFTNRLIATAAVGAVILNAGAALASIDKCQAELEKRADVLRGKAKTAYTKCADAVRRSRRRMK